jgi:hypothetical protein
MNETECIEIFNKEIETLQKHRHDADFMVHHGERTEKMIQALSLAISALQSQQALSEKKEK